MSLMSLPSETLEKIASHIESNRDLISLAQVSSQWKARIIPRHSQYRVIRIRKDRPHLWAHLAKRSDLARTIVAVHICEDLDSTSPEVVPTAFVNDAPETDTPVIVENIQYMCQALRHMTGLREFAWSSNYNSFPTALASQEDAIFLALSQCKSLLHLALWGHFGERARGVDVNSGVSLFPLWRIGDLQTLTVNGRGWITRMNMPHIHLMLSRSPDLQSLVFPMEFPALSKCYFPRLRKLVLTLQSGATSRIDASRARFIEDHQTLEELEWFPISSVPLTPGSLPALRRLRTSPGLAVAILSDRTQPPRPLEEICSLHANPEVIGELEGVDGKHLRSLRITQFDDIRSIAKLADLFPALTSLRTPPYSEGEGIRYFTPEEWICALRGFSELKTFSTKGFWKMVDTSAMDDDMLGAIILKVANSCPKLQEFPHWETDNTELKLITIRRDEMEITWDIRVPLGKRVGRFDSTIDQYR